ncbi:MAG TPA: hypothetical protein PLJ47_04640, partial [Candidatus Hydrogenedentes bacterium]|nr:hypothetical protein [Candidatus Hydrogenedentota bacterium]
EEAMASGGGPEGAREKNQQLREKLDGEMGKILSADQLAKWKEATAMRGGGGGRRGGGGAPPASPVESGKKKAEE